jgi:glyoxylase-like metal-dependent hydrolase (beta-lactamase superfamily II)
MAMIVGDNIFTGDAYIPGLGVKDFVPYADKEQAKQSMERILQLAEGKTIFAGHKVN